jgi:hypothetical protein
MAKAIRRPTLAFILIAEARGFLARKDIKIYWENIAKRINLSQLLYHSTSNNPKSSHANKISQKLLFRKDINYMNRKLSMNAIWSLVGVELVALLTSIHHLDELGMVFLVPALIFTILPLALIWRFARKPSKPLLWFYGIFAYLVVIGFGLGEGLWNHTINDIVFFLNNSDRELMAKSFPFFPPIGSTFHEVTGFLAFVASVFAVYFNYKFIASSRNITKQ